jgi:hypothetical protein
VNPITAQLTVPDYAAAIVDALESDWFVGSLHRRVLIASDGARL